MMHLGRPVQFPIYRVFRKYSRYKKKENSCFERLLRSELKRSACMKDVVQKFTNPGSLVGDSCAGTFFFLERSTCFFSTIDDLEDAEWIQHA